MNTKYITQRYFELKCIKAAAEASLEELEKELLDEITNNNDSPLVTEVGTFSKTYSKRRVANFSDTWAVLWAYVENTDPLFLEELRARYNDIFTVKVGGLDGLAKSCPEVRKLLDEVIEHKTSEEPTLKFEKNEVNSEKN
jgi:hypothetical protein